MQVWQWAIGIGVAFLAGVLIPTGAMLTKVGALIQIVTQLSARVDKLETAFNNLAQVVYEIKGAVSHKSE